MDLQLGSLGVADLRLIPKVFYRQNPDSANERVFFFFDEIQRAPGWELFVQRMLDSGHVHVILTGSSARLLSREIATELRRRSMTTEVFPFSFEETLFMH